MADPNAHARHTAEHYRFRAEVLRNIAEQTVHRPSRQALLQCADDYERIAASAEALHRAAEIVRVVSGGVA
jgi:hypothetical protein